jgi:hypothetical protein
MKNLGAFVITSMLAALVAIFAVSPVMAQDARVSIPSSKSFEQTVDVFKMR